MVRWPGSGRAGGIRRECCLWKIGLRSIVCVGPRAADQGDRAGPGRLEVHLVSSRYERASLIVTSNKAFGRWGEVFGHDVVAAAMIDRLVHHAEVVTLKGDSYRLKGRDLGRTPTAATTEE